MPFKISNITIEGFRGINKSVNLELNGQSVLLCGENGSGKSSLLQAIGWSFFGQLPFQESREFQKEDAIVNFFHPLKIAKVMISLVDNNNNSYTIKRSKKLSTSMHSRYGVGRLQDEPTQLEVIFQKDRLVGDSAQKKINQLLNLNINEFHGISCLHQNALHDLISDGHDVTNQIFDKLLGRHILKDFTNNLPTTQFSFVTNKLHAHLEQLQEQKEGILKVSKQKLSEVERDLENKGLTSRDDDLKTFLNKQKDLYFITTEIADVIKVTPKEIEDSTDIKCLHNNYALLKTSHDNLTEKVLTTYKTELDKLNELKILSERYVDLKQRFDKINLKTLKTIELEKERIERLIKKKLESLESLRIKLRSLEINNEKFQDIITDIQKNQKELSQILNKHGGKERDLQLRIQNTLEEKQQLEDQLTKQNIENTFLVAAHNMVKKVNVETCPLCSQSFNKKKSLQRLDGKIKKIENIVDIKNEITQIDQKIIELKNDQDQYNLIEKRINKNKETLNEINKELLTQNFKLSELSITALNNLSKSSENEIQTIQTEIDDLNIDKLKMEVTLEDKKSLLQKEELEKKIKSLLEVTTIRNLSQQLNDVIISKEKYIESLSSAITKTKILGKDLDSLTTFLEYLNKKIEIREMEQSLGMLNKEIVETKQKIVKTDNLNNTYKDIRNAAIQVLIQQPKILSTFQTDMNKIYSKLLSHQYFRNLKLLTEMERKKQTYSVIAENNDKTNRTYVQTRFSNTQLTITVLALFLSLSLKFPSDIGFIILDDPSQSMDQSHKKALAKLLQKFNTVKQLIIATHDQELAEYTKSIPKINQYTFSKWTLEGPNLIANNG